MLTDGGGFDGGEFGGLWFDQEEGPNSVKNLNDGLSEADALARAMRESNDISLGKPMTPVLSDPTPTWMNKFPSHNIGRERDLIRSKGIEQMYDRVSRQTNDLDSERNKLRELRVSEEKRQRESREADEKRRKESQEADEKRRKESRDADENRQQNYRRNNLFGDVIIRDYDYDRERRLRLLGLGLIPDDSYMSKALLEDKVNELIKKELNKETTAPKPTTDEEMVKLIKIAIDADKPTKHSKPKKSKKKKTSRKKTTKLSKKKKKTSGKKTSRK